MSKLIKDKSGKTYTEEEFRAKVTDLLERDYLNEIEKQIVSTINRELKKQYGKSFDKSKVKTEVKHGLNHIYYNNEFNGIVYSADNNGSLGVYYLKTEQAQGFLDRVKKEIYNQ